MKVLFLAERKCSGRTMRIQVEGSPGDASTQDILPTIAIAVRPTTEAGE